MATYTVEFTVPGGIDTCSVVGQPATSVTDAVATIHGVYGAAIAMHETGTARAYYRVAATGTDAWQYYTATGVPARLSTGWDGCE